MPTFPRCAVESCRREDSYCEHSSDKKCLFHCDKSGWYKLRADGRKDWFNHMNDVNLFWKVLEEEKIEKNDYYCPSFVFPLFPAGNPFAHTNSERIKSEFRFTGATFLSRATFSSVWLEAAAFFNGVTFMEPAVFSHFEVMEYADFSDTKFLGGINFSGIFYKEANFRNVMFSPDHPSSFHPYLASNPTYSVFRDTTYFTGINFPRSVAFRHVDLTHVSFGQSNLEEVTLQECLFNKVRGRKKCFYSTKSKHKF